MSIPGMTDQQLAEDAQADLKTYTAALYHGDTKACIVIEKKWGLYGLSPEQVNRELHEIGAPMLKAGRAN